MWNPNSIIFCFYLIFSILALWGIIEAWVHQSRTET
ncbi:TPA: phosphohydrolase, partial [Acinetobacter baumannii]|nr:phosphohydrolase [Acinetobacter baumannii]